MFIYQLQHTETPFTAPPLCTINIFSFLCLCNCARVSSIFETIWKLIVTPAYGNWTVLLSLHSNNNYLFMCVSVVFQLSPPPSLRPISALLLYPTHHSALVHRIGVVILYFKQKQCFFVLHHPTTAAQTFLCGFLIIFCAFLILRTNRTRRISTLRQTELNYWSDKIIFCVLLFSFAAYLDLSTLAW